MLCSGRPNKGIQRFLSALGPGEKYAGAANGTMVKDFDGNLLFLSCLEEKDLLHFQKSYSNDPEMGVYAFGVDDDLLYYDPSPFLDFEVRVNGMEKHPLLEGENQGHKLLKIMLAATKAERSRNTSLTEDEKRRFDATRSGPHFFEVIPKGITKATAVEELRKHLGIPKENVYCFGDSENDLPLMENYHGIAMGNAVESVKKAAEFVTKSCQENGVVFALSTLEIK